MKHLPPSKQQSYFLKAALEIGDHIISKAIKSPNGIFWKTIPYGHSWKTDASLGNGVSGIVLFIIELYKTYPDKKYLSLLDGATKWLIHYYKEQNKNIDSYFYGNSGILYTLLEAYLLNIDLTTKKEMIKLFENETNIEAHPFIKGDNATGTLSVLISIYNLFGFPHLHAIIKNMINNLLNSTNISNSGIYWGNPMNRGLIGSAGIASFLLEIGYITSDDLLLKVAKEASKHDDNLFDISDYYIEQPIDSLPLKNQFFYRRDKRIENFYLHLDNGIPGLLHYHLKSYKLLNEPTSLDKAISIYNRLKNELSQKTKRTQLGVIKGEIGILLSLLPLYTTTNSSEIRTYVYERANKIFTLFKNNKYNASRSLDDMNHLAVGNPSFFHGLSGLGYLFVKMYREDYSLGFIDPTEQWKTLLGTNKINIPRERNGIKMDFIILNSIERVFPLSLMLLQTKNIVLDSQYYSPEFSWYQNFLHFVSGHFSLESENTDVLKAIFDLEKYKLQVNLNLDENIRKIPPIENIEQQNKAFLECTSEKRLSSTRLKLSPSIRIMKGITCDKFKGDLEYEIIAKSRSGVIVYKFSVELIDLLKLFETPSNIRDIVTLLNSKYNKGEKVKLTHMKEIVLYALKIGLLSYYKSSSIQLPFNKS